MIDKSRRGYREVLIIGLPDPNDSLGECEGCRTLLDADVPHSCPVTGAKVLLSEGGEHEGRQ